MVRPMRCTVLTCSMIAIASAGHAARVESCGKAPLPEAELVATIAGNTLFREGSTLGISWRWAGYYLPERRMVARAWWALGSTEGHGSWRIGEDNQWCQFWHDTDWSKGGENCYRISREGDRLCWNHRSGPHKDDWVFRLLSGDPYDLASRAGKGEKRR